jgi:hypothetical protein
VQEVAVISLSKNDVWGSEGGNCSPVAEEHISKGSSKLVVYAMLPGTERATMTKEKESPFLTKRHPVYGITLYSIDGSTWSTNPSELTEIQERLEKGLVGSIDKRMIPPRRRAATRPEGESVPQDEIEDDLDEDEEVDGEVDGEEVEEPRSGQGGPSRDRQIGDALRLIGDELGEDDADEDEASGSRRAERARGRATQESPRVAKSVADKGAKDAGGVIEKLARHLNKQPRPKSSPAETPVASGGARLKVVAAKPAQKGILTKEVARAAAPRAGAKGNASAGKVTQRKGGVSKSAVGKSVGKVAAKGKSEQPTARSVAKGATGKVAAAKGAPAKGPSTKVIRTKPAKAATPPTQQKRKLANAPQKQNVARGKNTKKASAPSKTPKRK